MPRFVSFSLYGSSLKYNLGAERNVDLARQHYPGWTCVFWTDKSVPEKTITALINAGAVVVRQPPPGVPPMFWRFMINDVATPYHCYLVRDADSRIGAREAAATEQWLESGKPFFSARDHPAHARPINGGMWGAVAGCIPRMLTLIQHFKPTEEYHSDSEFLAKMVWPMVKDRAFQHDSFSRQAYPGSFPYPTKRVGQSFCGEVWEVDAEGNEYPRAGDRLQIPLET